MWMILKIKTKLNLYPQAEIFTLVLENINGVILRGNQLALKIQKASALALF